MHGKALRNKHTDNHVQCFDSGSTSTLKVVIELGRR